MSLITMAQLVEQVVGIRARRLFCGDCGEVIVLTKDPDESLSIVNNSGWRWDTSEHWPLCPDCVKVLERETCQQP